jgi:probable HAF family extracellular repeat protein
MNSTTLVSVVVAVSLAALTAGGALADQPEESLSEAGAVAAGGAVAGSSCSPGCSSYDAIVRLPDGTVRRLGTLGGFAAISTAINGQGTVVGQADTALLEPNGLAISLAFVADEDGMRSLGTLPGYVNSQAYGLNDRGEVVGWTYNTNPVTAATVQNFRGFVIDRAGVMHDLGTLGGATAIARDISNSGQIVGGSRIADGRNRAFLYDHGTMTELPSLGGLSDEATGINERGWMVGSAVYPGQPAGARRAVLWRNGGIEDLGTLGGTTARAWRINERGDVVGQARTANGQTHAFRWRDGVMSDLGTLGGPTSVALGLNDAGVVVGFSETGVIHPLFGPIVHAFRWEDGVMEDLGPLF